MSSILKSLKNKSSKKKSDEKKYLNRQRILLISLRGITYRYRHFINDLLGFLPHARKEPKFDSKKNLRQLNPVAELHNCNNILFFECRKHQDLYLWISKTHNGPTLKFYLQNLHTLDELNFIGNCLKGSRPILSFDESFFSTDHYKIVREMITQTFGVPPSARGSKPFIDRVMSFSIVDNKIWVRSYEIKMTKDSKQAESKNDDDLSLVEIGPRFVMTLILILEGSFSGLKIYENKLYVSPNCVRAKLKANAAEKTKKNIIKKMEKKLKKQSQILDTDPLSNDVLFKL